MDIVCSKRQSPPRLIALIKSDPTARGILTAISRLPASVCEGVFGGGVAAHASRPARLQDSDD